MIELIRFDNIEKWNNIVGAYKKNDVYYLCEYAISFMENEKGIPFLLNYEEKDCRICYPIIEKDIADFSVYRKSIKRGEYFDWNTPYGYGGPLSDKERLTSVQQARFKEELFQLAHKRKVVSQFLRFHPLTQNQKICDESIENVYVKDTIFIDLETDEDLMVQMDSKNRNLIRKAIKNNVVIYHDKGEYIDEFIRIYNTTMKRDNARSFYFFPKKYYEYMKHNMSEETEYFYAFKDGKMIAASLFFYNENYMHYHLSGNLVEYRTFAPTNLILYTAANWGRDKGIKAFHLGGGVGIEDSLFHFKKQFNKNGRIGFSIGRNIFMPDVYQKLLNLRQKIMPSFDVNNDYYIQYRKPED